MSLDPTYYRDLLAPVFRDRRLLFIGGGPVVAQAALAREFTALGAAQPFLLASSIGTGKLPERTEACWSSLEIDAADFLAAMRAYECRLAALPEATRQAIDRWDPEKRAVALGTILMSDVPEVAGRARYARRKPEWLALEDKVALSPFLDALGVRRGPLSVVRAESDSLRSAAARLDRGLGTVWAGDSSEGINGGAKYVRWVRCEDSAREAEAFFATHCERVRVQPFYEGIPCSIHGIVVPDGVAVFRPVESLVYRRPAGGDFVYAGSASFWDPNVRDRDQIRATARAIGRGLRDRVDYRGAFTVDGVLSEEGFVPTEINTRIGGALPTVAGALPELPLFALALAAQEGEKLDYQPAELERLVLDAADARRSSRGGIVVGRRRCDMEERALVEEGDSYREVRAGEQAEAFATVGPAAGGAFAAVRLVPACVRAGPSAAPRIARGFAYLDRALGTDVGPLVPAEPVR